MIRLASPAITGALALALVAGSAHSNGSQVSYKRYLPVVASTLRENHAKLDGSLIFDVQYAGPCRATIQTERGFTTVKWTDLANNAPHTQGKMTLYDISSPDGTHTITSRTKQPNDVGTVVGILDGNCFLRPIKW